MSVLEIDVDELRRRLREIVSDIDGLLSSREELRDQLIKSGRDIIRLSGWAINALHRGDIEAAEKYIKEMEEKARAFIENAKKDSFLWHSGFVNNVLSEYAEARLLYDIVRRGVLPSFRDLGIGEIAYLQGLGDVMGELRRLALDMLRQEKVKEAERLLEVMEAMYYELRVLEYPDALMPGVRHKVDVARRLLDDTKALLLTVKSRLCG